MKVGKGSRRGYIQDEKYELETDCLLADERQIGTAWTATEKDVGSDYSDRSELISPPTYEYRVRKCCARTACTLRWQANAVFQHTPHPFYVVLGGECISNLVCKFTKKLDVRWQEGSFLGPKRKARGFEGREYEASICYSTYLL